MTIKEIIKILFYLAVIYISAKDIFPQSGSGTSGDPYIITTPQQFSDMRNNMNAYYQLGADLDFGEFGNFTRLPLLSNGNTFHFDGMGYTIKNLTLTIAPTVDNQQWAIFRARASSGTANFTLQNVSFDNIVGDYINDGDDGNQGNETALIVAVSSNVNLTLTNIKVYNSTFVMEMSGEYNGFNPWHSEAAIFAVFDLKPNSYIVSDILVESCTLTVSGSASHAGNAAIVFSLPSNTTFDNPTFTNIACVNNVLNFLMTGGNYIGGIISRDGFAYNVTLNNCYSLGNTINATGNNYVSAIAGGLVKDATLTNCYAANNTLSGNAVGSLIGRVQNNTLTTISDSYYDEDYSSVGSFSGSGTLTDNSEEKTDEELQDQETYEDWDFDEVWGISSSYQNGYPFLLGNVVLVLLTPETGDIYIIPETVEITWIGSAGSNPEVDIYYSLNGGDDYTFLATSTSPYEWDFSLLGTTSYNVKIKTDLDGYEAESGIFWILNPDDKTIDILSPTEFNNGITIGNTQQISIRTAFIDSIAVEYSIDNNIWQNICEAIQTDGNGVDTVECNWIIPENITSQFWLRAIELTDTVLYVFEKELTRIGTTMPSQPQICWHTHLSKPVKSYLSYDQSCGWVSGLNHTGVITTLTDKAETLLSSQFTCSGDCNEEQSENADRRFITVGGVDKTINEFYTNGSTVTYKGRQYFADATSKTLRMNDLVNDINDIYVADLSPYIDIFDGWYHRGWTGIPTILQIYHVQQSKVLQQSFSGSQVFEELNDEDFTPKILIGGSYFGHGGLLVYSIDALEQPPIAAEPVSDTAEYNVTVKRNYFRGIFPKATRNAREPYKSTPPGEL